VLFRSSPSSQFQVTPPPASSQGAKGPRFDRGLCPRSRGGAGGPGTGRHRERRFPEKSLAGGADRGLVPVVQASQVAARRADAERERRPPLVERREPQGYRERGRLGPAEPRPAQQGG